MRNRVTARWLGASRPTARALACVVVAVSGLSLAAPSVRAAGSGVAVDEVTAVPADGILPVTGHGYGGGVGLSQWGAEGGAESGSTATAILGHYYPGTAVSSVSAQSVRVLLSGVASSAVPVFAASGLTVTGADGGVTTPPGDAAHARLRLVASGGELALQSSPDGASWTSEATVAAPATVTDSASTVRTGLANGTSRDYRGSLRVSVAGSALRAVDVLPLEQYLRGVVPEESPPSWQPAALQAQAVAARSYAAYAIAHAPTGQDYDICDTSACQVYGGARSYPAAGGAGTPIESASTDNAIAATAGQQLTVSGSVISAQYGASDGGYSVSGGQSYLPAAADPWDGVDPGNTSHAWSATVTAAQLQAHFPAVGTLTSVEVTRRDGNGDLGGRVLQVLLHGVTATGQPTLVTTTGDGFAAAHSWPSASDGIRSSWWQLGAGTATVSTTASSSSAGATAGGSAAGGSVVGGSAASASAASGSAASGSPAGTAATPTAAGLTAITPVRVVESSGVTPTARTVTVAGRGGVPAYARAVLVVAVTGALSRVGAGTAPPRAADLIGWPSGSNRSGAVALARLSPGAPGTGSALVQLGPDGSFQVATTAGRVGAELTVVGWAGPAAEGVDLATRTPVVEQGRFPGGTHVIPGLAPPAGATAAVVAVTGSASGPARSSLAVAGVPLQTLTSVPQTTTTLVPAGRGATVSAPAGAQIRVQLLGWLVAGGTRFTLRQVARPMAKVTPPVGVASASGAGIPVSSTVVLAEATQQSSRAGDAVLAAHGGGSSALRTALPAGRPASVLILLPLKDGLVSVRNPHAETLQLTVLGWS